MTTTTFTQPYEINGTLANGQNFTNDFTLTYTYGAPGNPTAIAISNESLKITGISTTATSFQSSSNYLGEYIGSSINQTTTITNPQVGTGFIGASSGTTFHMAEVFGFDVSLQSHQFSSSTVNNFAPSGNYEELRYTISDSHAWGSNPVDALGNSSPASTIILDANTGNANVAWATLPNSSSLTYDYIQSISAKDSAATPTLASASAGNYDYGNMTATFGDRNTIVCYAKGTLIQTERGYIAVEKLKVGDGVLTVAGSYEPIVWLGHRTVDCKRHPNQAEAHPVRICKDAFGPNQPSRDLYLSPLHSVYVDGILIPAIDLVNGVTVLQEVRSKITYYHVELPTHNAIYAEGLTAESYLDDSNRNFFIDDSTGQLVDMTAQFAEKQTTAQDTKESSQWFATVLRNGPEVEAVKARLELLSVYLLQKAAA